MPSYTIQGRAFAQGPLSLNRLQRVLRLFAGLAPDGGAPDLLLARSLRTAIDRLLSGDLPAEFFRAVLQGPVDEIDWGEADANVLLEVVEDFLSCNGGIATRLTRFFSALVSQLNLETPSTNSPTTPGPTPTP